MQEQFLEVEGLKSFLITNNQDLGVIVVHEIWGLNDNIIDISRRIANEGYSVFAPHLYTKYELLTPENIQEVMLKVWSIPPEKRNDPNAYLQLQIDEKDKRILELLVINREKLESEMINGLIRSYDYLVRQGFKKIVGMGFCMGGGLAFQLATEVPLDGVIVFYGRNPKPIETVNKIKGPILGLYAGEDPPIVSGLPELISTIIKYKKRHRDQNLS
ncbi:dienelactone hydrolase family protein [Acidianus sp. HS-5]|uniref:dienelactone hydrolase family protein n=1 Tax=Acidianus sp. HS-5 TaxID=2886040 RepID=UPI002112020C|nr:dienelactone hydrolase family protein [Acidianus sp. HS-5]BDC18279.1 carboxymethylenebutenolidase [Acidianus sp. HS-5]